MLCPQGNMTGLCTFYAGDDDEWELHTFPSYRQGRCWCLPTALVLQQPNPAHARQQWALCSVLARLCSQILPLSQSHQSICGLTASAYLHLLCEDTIVCYGLVQALYLCSWDGSGPSLLRFQVQKWQSASVCCATSERLPSKQRDLPAMIVRPAVSYRLRVGAYSPRVSSAQHFYTKHRESSQAFASSSNIAPL